MPAKDRTGPALLRPRSRALRWTLNGLGALILYGNVAVIFQPAMLGLGGLPRLPLPFVLEEAFLLPGMFGGYATEHSRCLIEGLRSAGQGQQGWLAIPVQEHFPERLAVASLQLSAVRFREALGRSGQQRAWRMMARKIRLRHNRLHPDRQVERVRFGVMRWPQSADGYWALARSRHVRHELWYQEQDTP